MVADLRQYLTQVGTLTPELHHHTHPVLAFLEKSPSLMGDNDTLLDMGLQFPELLPHVQYLLDFGCTRLGTRLLNEREFVAEPVHRHSPDQCFDVLKPVLDTIVEIFAQVPFLNTKEICVAGGAVRDLLVGRVPKDIDIFVPIKDTIGPLTSSVGEHPSFILDVLNSAIEHHSVPVSIWYGEAKLDETFTKEWGSQILSLRDALDYPIPTLFLLVELPNMCPTYPKIRTQVIFQTSSSTAIGVLSHFDLDICGYGITLGGMIQSDKAPCPENLILKSEGKIPVEMFSYWGINVCERLQSFEERGWDMSKAKEFVEKNPALCSNTAPHLAFY